MEFAIVGAVAFVASLLTFFSGFGLGTILVPVFIVFFPPEVAVALTAIVHLLNNFFKFALIGKHVNLKVVLRFGLPGMLSAVIGAWLLLKLSNGSSLATYTIGDIVFSITGINMAIGGLMIAFALFEILPTLKRVQFGEKALIPGGLLSGFFGGLSGHQGALRSTFLIKLNLSKEAFIATGIAIACLIDVARLGVYFSKPEAMDIQNNYPILIIAILSAFAGAVLGRQLLKKVTIKFLQLSVSILIIVLGIGLAMGIF